VRQREFLALLGPSGCGKTTLLNLIAGLLAPTRGTLHWWGAATPPTEDVQRRVAYVFQSPTLMPWASIATNVRLPLDLAGRDRAAADPAVADALALVGLERFASHVPRELSGGMQMRASIARALITSPALLLMDEPFGALDEFTRQRLDDELLALWRTRGMTIVFVTHSIAEAVYLATRIVVMSSRPGRVVDTFDVDAPHERGEAWRASPAFTDLSRLIAASVNAAGLAELDGR
jgi:NitT/TauT family transport system ATP-binding protein